MRAIGFTVVLVLVAVAVLASWVPGDSGRSWLVLPYWLDVARLEILLLAMLGGPAALVAGRAPYRVALAVLFLIIGIAVQVIAAMILSLRPGCVSAFSELPLTVFMVFISPLVVSQDWGALLAPSSRASCPSRPCSSRPCSRTPCSRGGRCSSEWARSPRCCSSSPEARLSWEICGPPRST